MKYIFLFSLLFIVGCNKDSDPDPDLIIESFDNLPGEWKVTDTNHTNPEADGLILYFDKDGEDFRFIWYQTKDGIPALQ